MESEPPDMHQPTACFSRAAVRYSGAGDFTADAVPVRTPGPGEALLETVYLTIDPAMRSWMSEGTGYQQSIPLGEVMRGGGIARVLDSRAEGLARGDLVQARLGWQTRPTSPGRYLQKLDLTLGTAEDWIGPLGLSAVTAYFGLRDIGGLRPNDRVLISAAAGGWVRSRWADRPHRSCRWRNRGRGGEMRFVAGDSALTRRSLQAEKTFRRRVARACPEGVDLYFDNVGGPTLDAALAHLRPGARVVLCGRISQTNAAEPYGVRNLGRLAAAHGRMQGFLVFNYHERYDEARTWLAARLRDGSLRQRLHVLEGLAQAPIGLGMLFRGENTGKLVVRVTAG